MSTDSPPTADLSELALLPPARFSSEQYVQMIASGILGPSDHVELIDGVITPMAPAGPEHNASLIKLTRLFAPALGRFDLLIQGTILVGDKHVFDPDLALLDLDKGQYQGRHATGEDIHLIVESSASSLRKDQEKKLPAYAAACIREYWIADLASKVLLVYREPSNDSYQSLEKLRAGDAVSPLACPEITLEVRELFA